MTIREAITIAATFTILYVVVGAAVGIPVPVSLGHAYYGSWGVFVSWLWTRKTERS